MNFLPYHSLIASQCNCSKHSEKPGSGWRILLRQDLSRVRHLAIRPRRNNPIILHWIVLLVELSLADPLPILGHNVPAIVISISERIFLIDEDQLCRVRGTITIWRIVGSRLFGCTRSVVDRIIVGYQIKLLVEVGAIDNKIVVFLVRCSSYQIAPMKHFVETAKAILVFVPRCARRTIAYRWAPRLVINPLSGQSSALAHICMLTYSPAGPSP